MSWKIRLLGILFVFSIFPFISFAGIDIVTLLPNPTGDDTTGEYIEIRNTGCYTVDLGGYRISDASDKTYVFLSSTMIASHENIRLPYSTTKIALNNSGIESVTLTDSGGVILDSYEYSGTQRDDIVIEISSTDENCTVMPPIITDTGAMTDTGITNTGIVDSESTHTGDVDTGSRVENNTGNTDTGNIIDSGSTSTGAEFSIPEIIGTGSSDTGSPTDTGISNTGSVLSGMIFPEIFPTLQHPTNAIFSSGIFDCTRQSPCRINITLDPIFTGAYLEKNYICEVITDTGSVITCNPNTLYFSTGGLLGFRLTSKTDMNQSVSISWGIVFMNTLIIDSPGISHSGSVYDSGSENISTGITNIETTNTGVSFPEIIPIFQNYTNTTNSGDILTCTTSPCRVNFTLDPIFAGSYIAHDYACEIQYGTGIYASCNPPQFYPIGTGSIDIRLIHKASGQKIYKTLQIIQNIPSQNTVGNQSSSNDILIDKNPPIAVLEFDGKLKSYHEQIGDYEMNCYTFTCAINLTAEKSYDSEGGKLSFLWYYGVNDVKTTKDPGERKYGLGDHQIWLRVIDPSGNTTSIRYYIHVLGERKEIIVKNIEKKSKSKNHTIKKETKKINKPKKIKKLTFFDPPKIVFQNSKFLEQKNGYICYTNSKSCSLNLTLSGSQKGIIYTWKYDNDELLISNNPKSKSLSPGVHTIQLIAGYSSDIPLWSQDIRVTVIKTRKSRKIKKAKIPKIVHMSGSTSNVETVNTQIYDGENEEKSDTTIPYAAMALLGGIMPIIVLRRLLTGVIWKI